MAKPSPVKLPQDITPLASPRVQALDNTLKNVLDEALTALQKIAESSDVPGKHVGRNIAQNALARIAQMVMQPNQTPPRRPHGLRRPR